MKRQLSEYDLALESYLAKLAHQGVETQVRAEPNVRIHYQSREPAVLVPMLQSVLTGLFVGMLVSSIAYLLGSSRLITWGLVAFLVTCTASWLYLVWSWRKIVLMRLEELGRPDVREVKAVKPQKVKVELHEEGGKSVKFIDLPGEWESLYLLAVGLLDGVTLTESNWTGPGKPYSRPGFSELRNELVKRGLARWNSPGTPARGISLTSAGWAVMKKVKDSYSPTDEG